MFKLSKRFIYSILLIFFFIIYWFVFAPLLWVLLKPLVTKKYEQYSTEWPYVFWCAAFIIFVLIICVLVLIKKCCCSNKKHETITNGFILNDDGKLTNVEIINYNKESAEDSDTVKHEKCYESYPLMNKNKYNSSADVIIIPLKAEKDVTTIPITDAIKDQHEYMKQTSSPSNYLIDINQLNSNNNNNNNNKNNNIDNNYEKNAIAKLPISVNTKEITNVARKSSIENPNQHAYNESIIVRDMNNMFRKPLQERKKIKSIEIGTQTDTQEKSSKMAASPSERSQISPQSPREKFFYDMVYPDPSNLMSKRLSSDEFKYDSKLISDDYLYSNSKDLYKFLKKDLNQPDEQIIMQQQTNESEKLNATAPLATHKRMINNSTKPQITELKPHASRQNKLARQRNVDNENENEKFIINEKLHTAANLKNYGTSMANNKKRQSSEIIIVLPVPRTTLKSEIFINVEPSTVKRQEYRAYEETFEDNVFK